MCPQSNTINYLLIFYSTAIKFHTLYIVPSISGYMFRHCFLVALWSADSETCSDVRHAGVMLSQRGFSVTQVTGPTESTWMSRLSFLERTVVVLWVRVAGHLPLGVILTVQPPTSHGNPARYKPLVCMRQCCIRLLALLVSRGIGARTQPSVFPILRGLEVSGKYRTARTGRAGIWIHTPAGLPVTSRELRWSNKVSEQ